MFVCPHCQFDNPETHKFCQRCGTSLVEKECPVCGTLVAFSSEYCQQCHAMTGTTWKTLLVPLRSQVRSVPAGSVSRSSHADGAPYFSEASVLTAPMGKFLDIAQRYQLLEPLPQQLVPEAEIEVRVLDHQPLRVTNLALQTASEPTETTVALIPAIAESYLTLQNQFPLLPLPHLHDAWQQQQFAVLLLEDRSHLPLLEDLWRDEATEPLQSLHWLRQMVELWVALAEQQCCRSLLELNNLRVDEDQLLCLQRLYTDRPEQPASLSQLSQVWQQILHRSQRTQNAELARLCVDLKLGAIATPDDLRLRIEAIAATLQAVAPPPGVPMASSHPQDSSTETTQDLLPESAGLSPEHPSPAAGLVDDDEETSDDLPTVVLAMRLVSLEDAGRTDIGRQRTHNEDCFSIQTELHKKESPQGRAVQAKGLYILCDGMGGHASGEVASALAVETLQAYFAEHWQDKLPSEETIRAAVQLANRNIFDQNQQNSSAGSGRMGTTLVLLLIQDAEAAIVHVGDSRLYRLSRRRGLQQMTTDHEVGQREIQRGVEPALAYARPDAYQLTQALGPRDENFLNPDIKFLELNEDGILLLCSDGLSDNDLLETHWQTHLEPLLDQRSNLEQGVNSLIELANQHNGHDNITAIAVRVKVRPNLDQMPR
ncbi:MAG: serine/threonine phosphatase [Elainella sp.]